MINMYFVIHLTQSCLNISIKSKTNTYNQTEVERAILLLKLCLTLEWSGQQQQKAFWTAYLFYDNILD